MKRKLTSAENKTQIVFDCFIIDYTSTSLIAGLNKYTSKELQTGEFDTNLSTGLEMFDFGSRFYDPQLGVWFTPDPAEQFSNPYLAMGNNPVMYVDPDGRIAFVPILVGMAYGALIGAGTSAAIYSVQAGINGTWNWNDFGRTTAFGAVGGALGGGFGQLATSLGSFGQSVGYNILSNSAAQVGTSVAFGNDITLGTIAGSALGGYLGAKFGNWSGVKGSWLKNAAGELGFSALKGSYTGAISGYTGAIIDGENPTMGFTNGMINGSIGHAVGAGINIGLWGATTTLPTAAESKIQESERFFGPYKMGENRPAYRKGGLYQMAFKREVTWGRNIMVNKNTSTSTYVHETMHYYQQMYQGFGYYQSKGIYEIGILEGLRGINPYYTPGTNEYDATFYEWFFMERGFYDGN